jgi:hypothetical protein
VHGVPEEQGGRAPQLPLLGALLQVRVAAAPGLPRAGARQRCACRVVGRSRDSQRLLQQRRRGMLCCAAASRISSGARSLPDGLAQQLCADVQCVCVRVAAACRPGEWHGGGPQGSSGAAQRNTQRWWRDLGRGEGGRVLQLRPRRRPAGIRQQLLLWQIAHTARQGRDRLSRWAQCVAGSWHEHTAPHLCAATPAHVHAPTPHPRARARPQVSRSRRYTPTQDDVGFVLKYECQITGGPGHHGDIGRPMLAFTSRVRPAPNLPVRGLVALPLPYALTKAGPGSRFTVLTYNMLADLYAKVGACAVWARVGVCMRMRCTCLCACACVPVWPPAHAGSADERARLHARPRRATCTTTAPRGRWRGTIASATW